MFILRNKVILIPSEDFLPFEIIPVKLKVPSEKPSIEMNVM